MNKPMMKTYRLSILLTLALFSCLQDDDLPTVENITRGSKWGIQIGSTHAEVFSQLQ